MPVPIDIPNTLPPLPPIVSGSSLNVFIVRALDKGEYLVIIKDNFC